MNKQLKSEIIAIGTELLLGQIANTNAQWLSEQLATHGIDTYYHTVVGDNLSRVENIFKQAHERSDIIIVSGGLGPTEDDMTREAFQRLSKLPIIEDKQSMNKIKSYFTKQGTTMTINNKKQARVFEGSQVIQNVVGMAPGMFVTYENKTWVFLPGVPRELMEMVKSTVLPYLKKINGQTMVIKSTELRFIGIGEAQLVHELHHVIKDQKNPTIAPLAKDDGVVLRLTAKGKSTTDVNERLKVTENKITAKVGQFVYGYDNEKIEEKIIALLKEKDLRISSAESLTGGKFTERLISVPGASSVIPGGIVCYSKETKRSLLNIPIDVLNENGTVSEECALEMAKNVCEQLNTQIGISFTGVAGPNQLEGHQAGTVFIAIYSTTGEKAVSKFTFTGDRYLIRHRTVMKGFELLLNFLK